MCPCSSVSSLSLLQERVGSIHPEDLMQIISHMDSLDNHKVSELRPVVHSGTPSWHH
jgi:hypothetical protein